jgi:hypothetical protein
MGKGYVDLTPEQRAAAAERERLLKLFGEKHGLKDAQERMRPIGEKLALNHLRKTTPPASQPTPQQRKPRKHGAGRPPKFEQGQLAWLRQRYYVAVKADPLLAKHEAAIPHVQNLAKIEYGIDAGRNTLLKYVIRPVLRPAENNQK